MLEELWTAIANRDGVITFEITMTGYNPLIMRMAVRDLVPLFAASYPSQFVAVLAFLDCPWSFRKIGEQVYFNKPKSNRSTVE